jgi:hypothetical protein
VDETNRRLRQRLGSFFSSLTGLLTGAAALIGAVVGILTAVGVIGGGAQHAPAQTAASWAARANAICAQTNETVGALPDPHSIAPTDVAGYLKTSVVLGRRLLRRLTVLAPPSGREAEVAGFLRLGAQLNDATSELAHDVSLGDLGAAADRATQLSHLNTRFNDAAVALGATTCAEGSSVSDVFGG